MRLQILAITLVLITLFIWYANELGIAFVVSMQISEISKLAVERGPN